MEAPERPKTFGEQLKTAAFTAEVLDALGALPETDAPTLRKEKQLLDAVMGRDKSGLSDPMVAAGAAAFLRTYGSNLAIDVAQVRAALTYKLLELADHGDPKIELRAIELLGKHVDIGLFSDKSEVTVKYENPEALQEQILLRVKRLTGGDVTDEKPLLASLEQELSRIPLPKAPVVDAEYTEVEDLPQSGEIKENTDEER